MTEVLQSSPSHFSSPSSSTSSPCGHNDTPLAQNLINTPLISVENGVSQEEFDLVEQEEGGEEEEEEEREEEERKEREREGDQLSLLALLVTAFRKSLIGCSVFGGKDLCSMEIGVPTNVRHVAHVTFDRFNGFLGLPVEFEPEVPRRPPSASTNVFGVSTESMQLSYDSRGNCVPTILLMMQRQLYGQGGLQAEGIFRITGENSQEQYVREQLNRGLVPEGIDVHCLAGLIKAWFRELPRGVLDSLSPEQVMQSQSEEECSCLVRLLPPTEAALLDWAINLMADVAQLEHLNKMNARNVAMVFAPNMTQMSDPLTALMHAVQVMNFLKTLIMKTLREREDRLIESAPISRLEPSDRNGHQSSSQMCNEDAEDDINKGEEESVYVTEEPNTGSPLHKSETDSATDVGSRSSDAPLEKTIPRSNQASAIAAPLVSKASSLAHEDEDDGLVPPTLEKRQSLSSSSILKKVPRKAKERTMICSAVPVEKNKGAAIVALLNPRTELFEAWR